jgi:hypothetical protein
VAGGAEECVAVVFGGPPPRTWARSVARAATGACTVQTHCPRAGGDRAASSSSVITLRVSPLARRWSPSARTMPRPRYLSCYPPPYSVELIVTIGVDTVVGSAGTVRAKARACLQ